MRQTISAVIEHTTKNVLEERARIEGMPLSRYIRKVLEHHERQPYESKADVISRINQEYGDD